MALLANSADTVPRAVTVASEVKRHIMKHRNEDLMQFIDYPGRKDSSGQGSRETPFAPQCKAPPRQMKIYLSRIRLDEFVPKQPAPIGSSGPQSEKERLHAHYATHPPVPLPGSNAPTSILGGGSLPATLHKKHGADPRKPPLPPKAANGKEEEGRLRSFWSRVTSD